MRWVLVGLCGEIEHNKRLKNLIDLYAKEQVVAELKNRIKMYYECDNENCGNGALCNFCALKEDIKNRISSLEKENKK